MYVSRERRSSVQAMQYSNGLTNPVALWLGHLMFDGLIVLTISTVIIVVFATVANQQLQGLGYLVSGHALIFGGRYTEVYVVVHSCAIWDNWRSIRILCITVHFFSFSFFCNCGWISGGYVYCERSKACYFLLFS